jgi:hypothetical protein
MSTRTNFFKRKGPTETMRNAKRLSSAALVTLVALAAAVGVSACGSSANASSKKVAATSTTKPSSTKPGSTTGTAARSAFTACLKQHGVTLPSRPAGGFRPGGTTTNGAPPTGTTPNGGGYRGHNGGGGGFFGGGGRPGAGAAGGAGRFAGGSSKFAKAFKACGSKLGSNAGGRFGGGGGFRGAGGAAGAGGAGGAPQFSKATLTSFVSCVRKNGYAAMPDANTSGTGQPFPSSIEKNAQFQAASKKCASILVRSFRGAGQPGAPTTSTTSTTSSS